MMVYPLTHAQRRIWYNEKIHSETTMHNLTGVVRIKSKVDYIRLTEAIKTFIKNNDSLRLRIDEQNGEPVQYLVDYEEKQIELLDFSVYDDPLLHYENWLEELRYKKIQLLNSSLYSFTLFKLGENDGGYIGRFHHIISDGWSLNIASEQISKCYTELGENNVPHLDSKNSYIDYVSQEKRYLKSNRYLKNKSFWNNVFKPLPENLVTSKSRNTLSMRETFHLDNKMSIGIKKFQKDFSFSPNTLFISALLFYLFYITNERDIIIGTPVVNRSGKKEKNTFGMFTSTMPFRGYVDDEITIGQFISKNNRGIMSCYKNQKYPYNLLIEDLKLNTEQNSLFTTCVNYYNTKFNHYYDNYLCEIEEVTCGHQPYKLQLVIRDWEKYDNIAVDFDYNTDEYCSQQIQSMFRHLCNILRFMLENPNKKLREIEMLSREEKDQLTTNINKTQSNNPITPIPILFEEQVKKHTDKTACIYEGKEISYIELNQNANKLARFLKKNKITPGEIVAIIGHPSIEIVTAILAVMKSGASYVPIDPNYPAKRINFMLKDSQASILLYFGTINSEVEFGGETCNVEDEHIYLEDGSNLDYTISPESVAYIIYTSGSTGTPKGVMVTHRALTNYLYWANKTYITQKNDVFAFYSSIAFDLTLTSIFTPLIGGNQIAIYSQEDSNEFVLLKILRENLATIVKLTPSHLSFLRDTGINHSKVNTFIVGGEDLKVGLAKEIHNMFNGEITIYNEYGPTETVVGCMIHRYDYWKDTGVSVPIGTPIDNTRIYILNSNLRPVPFNIKGEIFIAGDGVSNGYINKKQLTQDRFIKNPFAPEEVMYKTGDIGLWLEEGVAQCIGRSDNQVKVNGYRIELNEIENALLSYPGIQNSIAIVYRDDKGKKYLCAYYQSSKKIADSDLYSYLRQHLPTYMIPRIISLVSSLPLTTSGKVDVKNLPVPKLERHYSEECEKTKNDKQRILVEVCQDVLQVDKVSLMDDFITLGGDSIKAIQVMAKLKQHEYELSVRDIMSFSSITELSKQMKESEMTSEQGLISGEVKRTPIVSWFTENTKKNRSSILTQSVFLVLHKPLEIKILEKAFEKVIEHHDSLRLKIGENASLEYANSLLNQKFTLDYYDNSFFDVQGEKERIAVVYKKLKSKLTIKDNFPITAAFIDFGVKKGLLIVANHLNVDGLSWNIILEDLFTVYSCLKDGSELSLPIKTNSFQMYSKELEKYSKQDSLLEEVEYWEEIENSKINLPVDMEPTVTFSQNFEVVADKLDCTSTQLLISNANKAFNTAPVELLMAALAMSVQKIMGLSDFTYDVENHGRHLEHVDISRTVGWFTVMHPLRIKLIEDDVRYVIPTVKEAMRNTPSNGLGYGILKYDLNIIKSRLDEQIIFNYLGEFNKNTSNDNYKLSESSFGFDIANQLSANIGINCWIYDDKLTVYINYRSDMYHKQTINELLSLYLENLKRIIEITTRTDDIYFTPSDFETAKVSQIDIDLLFS